MFRQYLHLKEAMVVAGQIQLDITAAAAAAAPAQQAQMVVVLEVVTEGVELRLLFLVHRLPTQVVVEVGFIQPEQMLVALVALAVVVMALVLAMVLLVQQTQAAVVEAR